MRLTASRQGWRRGWRRGGAAALAGVGAAALALTAAPVAQAAPASTLATDVSEAGSQCALSTEFDELRELIAYHEANGGVHWAAARKMRSIIGIGEDYCDGGAYTPAALWVENARSTAEHETWVPSEVARTEIVAAIDELVAQLWARA